MATFFDKLFLSFANKQEIFQQCATTILLKDKHDYHNHFGDFSRVLGICFSCYLTNFSFFQVKKICFKNCFFFL